jgi:hypothetical protein
LLLVRGDAVLAAGVFFAAAGAFAAAVAAAGFARDGLSPAAFRAPDAARVVFAGVAATALPFPAGPTVARHCSVPAAGAR